MKKFVMIVALVGMVAAPAFAGLAPEAAQGTVASQASLGFTRGAGLYVPNSPSHVYDMMPPSPGILGPEDLRYQVTQNPSSGAFCNLINLKPGATNISLAHFVLDGRPAPAAGFTFSIAFRNDTGTGIGAFLTTTSLGFSAWYVYPGVPNTLTVYTLSFPTANVTQSNIWACVQGNAPFRVRTGTQSGNELNGNVGDGGTGALYIGSSIGGVYASGGVGIGSASLASSFTFGAPQVGNWHMALGGAPEPATAVLLGLAGLVALRRRKVKA
jgi:hypothetical protein